MDEFGNGIADDSPEMVSEGMTNASTELRKRRSTRIVQAVPLVVTGVDALGRPFMERTSSLIINCHGARYQSKHYVLKNMWVKLEIPHPESGQAPRTVRGRVAWIQRPRTVRQLFQVALELEIPGNVWGIAFPPEDWFGFDPDAEQHRTVNLTLEPTPADSSAALNSEQGMPPIETELPPPAVGTDNVRVFPAPTSATDASLQLARQMTRLVAEAKQQIHSTAHEVVSQVVAAEQRIAFEQWEQKFAAARAEVSNEADRAVERIQKEIDERTQTAHAAAAEGLKNDLPGWVAPQLERVTQELTGRIADAGTAQVRGLRSAWNQQRAQSKKWRGKKKKAPAQTERVLAWKWDRRANNCMPPLRKRNRRWNSTWQSTLAAHRHGSRALPTTLSILLKSASRQTCRNIPTGSWPRYTKTSRAKQRGM